MLNQEVNDLIEAITSLRLNRGRISCVLDTADELESQLLLDLGAARIAAATAAVEIKLDTDTNPYSRGDLVIITNDL